MTTMNMNSEAVNLSDEAAGVNCTASYVGKFGGQTKMSPRRVLTHASSSGSDPLASPNNGTISDGDGQSGESASNLGIATGAMLKTNAVPALNMFSLEKQYSLQKELLSRQYEDEQCYIEQERRHRMQMLLKQNQQLMQQLSDEAGDPVHGRLDVDGHNHQQAHIEHIKHKRKDEESAVASTAVKLKLRECLLNKSQRELHNMSNSPPEFRHWSTQHSSLEQHSPPTIEWSPPLKLSLGQYDEEYPLRKTVSEPSLKMRSSKLSLRQKVIQRNSQLMRKREFYRRRNPATLDHDSSPNSPPSVVSSQGSSIDISFSREDHRASDRLMEDHSSNKHAVPVNSAGALSRYDAEVMLAMSRQYGSLPMMGCWPTLSSSQADSTSVEAQMKVLELAHRSADQPDPPPPVNPGFCGPVSHPDVNNGGHLIDPYMQALMMARCTLQRTRSEPIPLPVQLLLQQHKMLLNKQQQDQQLKENHKLYLKKKLLHQASAKKLHMENVDEAVESRIAREHLIMASESEEEADVIVIDDPVSETEDTDSARRRRAFLDQTRMRTLSCGPLNCGNGVFSDRVAMDCGQSSLVAVHSPMATSASVEKRSFVTGLAYHEAMLKHACLCQNNAAHPENPGRLVSIWNRLSTTGLVEKCELVKCRRATREELQTCHSESYVHMYANSARHRDPAVFELFAPRFCKLACGGIGVDVDTVWNEDETVLAARLAAGCSIELTTKVACGELDNGFALVRPPGHHAEDTQAMGFCFFNSIGISTKLLLDRFHMRRLLVVDWDVHHGNSTQQLFYADSRVLYISLHRYDDGNFFPGTGASTECGIERGTGYTVNVAWTGAVMGDAEYLSAFRTIVMPIAREFRPEMVLVSAGFDAAAGHPAPLGGYKVSPQCFGHMTQQLMTLADRKVALVLEGGYEVDPLCNSAEACLRALLNEKIDLPVESELRRMPCRSAIETLKSTIKCQSSYWPCVLKFADTLELSYMDAQQRVHEEAETLSALAGLSVMSTTVPANCLQQRPDSTTDIAEELEPMEDG